MRPDSILSSVYINYITILTLLPIYSGSVHHKEKFYKGVGLNKENCRLCAAKWVV